MVQVELVVHQGQVVVAQEGTSVELMGSKWFVRSKWIKQCRKFKYRVSGLWFKQLIQEVQVKNQETGNQNCSSSGSSGQMDWWKFRKYRVSGSSGSSGNTGVKLVHQNGS
jgi:predicted glycosyl hydrolase (DUF1957 family)